MLQRQLPALAMLALLLSACGTYTNGTAASRADLGPNATPEGDIASIVTAANQGEIEQGNAAASRASSQDVRSFAQMMVTDHTAALNSARDTFNRAGINPTPNDITAALERTSPETIRNLNTYQGAAFDQKYMQAQVDLHDWLLRQLDRALIPSARTPELRTLLQTQRASVAAHLEHARRILGGLPRT
jgi:putative membrane protein